jgi:TPP-dependent pyruvate/acetoin dehydrogenase alpha subunit
MSKETSKVTSPPFEDFKQLVINDYRIAVESREASLLGRKEVLTGKAKFGIFGDGKEVAQLAMARSFKEGDFRSGYYRDQTFMFATGNLSIQQLVRWFICPCRCKCRSNFWRTPNGWTLCHAQLK